MQRPNTKWWFIRYYVYRYVYMDRYFHIGQLDLIDHMNTTRTFSQSRYVFSGWGGDNLLDRWPTTVLRLMFGG